MPSAKDVFEYRRGFARLLDLPFGRQEVTINIGSAAALFLMHGSSCQDAKDERSCGKHQHECGRPDALDIADTQMGHDGTHEIEPETDSRRDPDGRPPESNHESAAPANSHAASSGKYFNGRPTVS